MNSISDFYKIIWELIDLIKILTAIQENKLKAIVEKSLTKLDACIKDEQVQIMKLRGLERKREQIQASLGYSNFTFSQIVASLQDSEKKEAKELFDILQKATNDFNTINKSVKTSLEVNLYSINSKLEKINTDIKNNKNISGTVNNFNNTNRFV